MSQHNFICGDLTMDAQLIHHGEEVTYRSKGCLGTVRRKALIDRDPPGLIDAAGNIVTPSAIIRFHNDPDKGIPAAQVDTGGDLIEYKLKFDSNVTAKRYVFQVVSSDGGATQLLVR